MRNKKRTFLIIAIAAVLVIAGLAVAFYKATEYVVPILMYHSIDNNDKETKLSVSPKNFSRQMKFLRRYHYNVVTLEKAISYISRKEKPPARTIAITFDDGFLNNYKEAYPTLKKYNIPAAIFVIVNRVGNPGFMTWEEIKEMSDSGVITIGSHTRTHFWLIGCDPQFLQNEIVNSKKILEEKLGKKISLFCYPMGAFDADSKKAVENAGYAAAVATSPRGVSPIDLYAIKRVKISRTCNNLFMFWAETTRAYIWFKRHKEEE